MPHDTDSFRSPGWARAAAVDAGGAFESLSWWLMGGATLLVWTGLALLLTSA
ncbi:hypothetical protein LZ009_10990 [Ramlibacter sp. XY19]|uniref:hypothetical protein n=1 Tax=Ramlibacter paludis TaxID=2908000 RepID=UPI0023DAEFA4|nr:hypothetical protein [Ramlibacter paludis]MCG2593307.1 hypothetical protein [Ramlibacter paludis]